MARMNHSAVPGRNTAIAVDAGEATRPIALRPVSVNQTFPSGPAVMPSGLLPVGRGNSVMMPVGVMRAILGDDGPTVNHMLPSGPAAMVTGNLPLVRTAPPASATPPVVILTIAAGFDSNVNQRWPSAPAAMLSARRLTHPTCGTQVCPRPKLVNVPPGVRRPIESGVGEPEIPI